MVRLSNAGRAEVLTQALPYIQKYNGKVIVVKYGGNAMISQELKEQVMEDIVLLSLVGVKVVLVHGGGPEITDMLKRIGKQSEFVNGLRVPTKKRQKSCKWSWLVKSTRGLSTCWVILVAERLVFRVWMRI